VSLFYHIVGYCSLCIAWWLTNPITITNTLCKWCVVSLVGCWSITLLVCHIVVCLMLSSTQHCHSPLVLLLFHRIISCYSYCITCITMTYYPPFALCKWWTSTIIKNKEKKNEYFHSFFLNLSFLPFFPFVFSTFLFLFYQEGFFWLVYNNFFVLLKEFSKKFNINKNTFNFYLYVFAKQIGKTI